MLRELNQLVTRRAKAEIAAADKRERQKSGGEVTWQLVADRMAAYLNGEKKKHDARKQLGRYLEKGHVWRLDWLEAFCRGLGLDPAELTFMDPEKEPQIREATRAQLLWSGVGHRLDLAQTRRVTRLANQLLDNPSRWELVVEIAEMILESDDAGEASLAIVKCLSDTKAFDAKRRDLRKKPRARRNVRK